MATRKGWLGLSTFLAVCGVGLIVAAFSTDRWIISHPRGDNGHNVTLDLDSNDTAQRHGGEVTFGLFSGYRQLNFRLGTRVANLIIKCDTKEGACAYVDKKNADVDLGKLVQIYQNTTDSNRERSLEDIGLFSFSLYVANLVMLVLGLVWGLITIAFSLFNVFGRPIETITGPSGLFAWNFLSLLSLLATLGIYLGLYFTQFKTNILSSEHQEAGLTSKDLTDLDYSFYFVVGSAIAFFVNIILLAFSGQRCSCSYSRSGEKEVDNDIILF